MQNYKGIITESNVIEETSVEVGRALATEWEEFMQLL